LRLRRPPQATIDQVHISRDGEYAIIEHADTAYGITRLLLGPMLQNMSDAEVLEVFNDIIAAQDASVADPANRPVEIPRGRPQIEWLEDLQQWSVRGKCCAAICPMTKMATWSSMSTMKNWTPSFLSLIKPFAGWGMRLTFIDESQVYDEPSVIIRGSGQGQIISRHGSLLAGYLNPAFPK